MFTFYNIAMCSKLATNDYKQNEKEKNTKYANQNTTIILIKIPINCRN